VRLAANPCAALLSEKKIHIFELDTQKCLKKMRMGTTWLTQLT